MSEAELHILKARMLAGRKAKAGRGELGKPVPMGYVRHPSGEVMFDPDEQAQATIRLVFELFDRFKTIGKVMTYLVAHEIRMPVRVRGGPQKGDLEWRRVSRASLHDLFANPIYAGVYAYGVRAVEKRRQKPGRPKTGRRSPRARQAEVFLHDCLPAYIGFERYQLNQAQLQSNRAAWGRTPRRRAKAPASTRAANDRATPTSSAPCVCMCVRRPRSRRRREPTACSPSNRCDSNGSDAQAS